MAKGSTVGGLIYAVTTRRNSIFGEDEHDDFLLHRSAEMHPTEAVVRQTCASLAKVEPENLTLGGLRARKHKKLVEHPPRPVGCASF